MLFVETVLDFTIQTYIKLGKTFICFSVLCSKNICMDCEFSVLPISFVAMGIRPRIAKRKVNLNRLSIDVR